MKNNKEKPVVDLLEHQATFVFDQTRYVALVGGYRAGKTVAAAHKAVYLANENVGYDGALMSPTYSMLCSVMIPTMEEVLHSVGLPFSYRASPPHSFTLHFPNGNVRIFLLSSENYKRAAGLSLAWFVGDEFDLIPLDVAEKSWRMMISRLTKGNLIQGALVSTPEGYNVLHKIFEEEKNLSDGTPDPNKKLIRARTADNPFIDEQYVEQLKSQYPAKLLAAYLEGHFVNLTSGNVYYCFDREKNKSTLDFNDFHPQYPLSLGMDFNINVMATTIGIFTEDKRYYILDEIHGCQNTEAVSLEIKRRYPGRKIHVYPDATGGRSQTSAAISDLAILRNMGFEVFAKKSNPYVKDRIAAVNTMLCDGKGDRRLFVHPRCTKIIKTLEQQGYDKDGQPDKSGGLDHFGDSIGYPIYYKFPVVTQNSNRVVVSA